MTFALLAPPVGLRPPYATSRAKLAPNINRPHYRQGGPCSTPIGGPVWTPIDTLTQIAGVVSYTLDKFETLIRNKP